MMPSLKKLSLFYLTFLYIYLAWCLNTGLLLVPLTYLQTYLQEIIICEQNFHFVFNFFIPISLWSEESVNIYFWTVKTRHFFTWKIVWHIFWAQQKANSCFYWYECVRLNLSKSIIKNLWTNIALFITILGTIIFQHRCLVLNQL